MFSWSKLLINYIFFPIGKKSTLILLNKISILQNRDPEIFRSLLLLFIWVDIFCTTFRINHKQTLAYKAGAAQGNMGACPVNNYSWIFTQECGFGMQIFLYIFKHELLAVLNFTLCYLFCRITDPTVNFGSTVCFRSWHSLFSGSLSLFCLLESCCGSLLKVLLECKYIK